LRCGTTICVMAVVRVALVLRQGARWQGSEEAVQDALRLPKR